LQRIVAVEKGLKYLTDILEAQGYEVVAFGENDLRSLDAVDAVVVTGEDVNLMNIQEVVADVPVIDASGKTPEDILGELDRL